jgi:hypothetical protein
MKGKEARFIAPSSTFAYNQNSMKRIVVTVLAILFLAPLAALAQTPPPPATSAPQSAARLRVFLDCQDCFSEYLREEIEWADFVRDAADANVHVLSRSQETGGGGRENVLRFVGAGVFQGIDRELRAVTLTGDPEDVRRRAVLRTISIGLLGYLAHEGLPEGFDVTVEMPRAADADARQAGRDPWNFWVFSLSGGGSYSAEQTSKEWQFEGSASADRVTSDWKVSFGIDFEHQTEQFDLDEDEPLEAKRRSKEFDGFLAKSLGPHWSFGMDGGVNSSTFGNQRFQASFGPAIEFSVFPYRDYATRQLVAQYQIGGIHSKYNEITLFGKLKETLAAHEASIRFDSRQRWGSIQTSLEWSQYLHDFSKHRLELNSDLSFRITRGLSVNFEIEASRIHDQLSLPRRSASAEEVLLRLRELQSSYEVRFDIGLTYRFGSIFNNVVNPRFGRGGGGGGNNN